MMHQVINAYAFAASVAVNYSVAVKGFNTGTSTGNQDITSTAITGVTPEAAIILGSFAAVASGGSETDEHSLGIGFLADQDVALWTSSDHARTETLPRRMGHTDRFFHIRNVGNSATVHQATGSFVSGGVRLNYTTNTTNNRATLCAFTGVSAKVGVVALGTGTSAITVSGIGFQPDVVILAGTCGAIAGTSTTFMGQSFGIALADGTQRCVLWIEADGVTAGGSPFQAIRNDCAGGQVTGGTLNYKLVVGGFGPDGFTITPSASSGSDDIAYLALKFDNGNALALKDFTTPTATGSASITGVGFTPQLALAVLTNLEAVNTHAGATSDLQGALSINCIGSEQWATSWAINSGSDPTDTASNCQNVALLGGDGPSTNAIVASLSGFNTDGLDLSYSAVQGTGKIGFMLLVESD
jgi:hypothetical protein